MGNKNLPYINRDLSWLSFNERVLQEAADKDTPLLERIKFLGIFSNNRDEFFRVRIGAIKRFLPLGKKAVPHLGSDPALLLDQLHDIVIEQQHKFEQIYKGILRELRKNNIFIVNEKQLSDDQEKWVKQYFEDEVMPAIFPVVIDDNKKFPYLRDKSSYLFMKLKGNETRVMPRYGLIEIPVPGLPRFVVMPDKDDKKFIIVLDDVIRFCLDDIFSVSGYKPGESYSIKLTRDAEISVDNDFTENLPEKISKGIKKRQKGQPVRLVHDERMPQDMLKYLMGRIRMTKKDNPVPAARYLNFRDYINFPKLGKKEWVFDYPHALNHPRLEDSKKSILKTIREGDILLNYPYQNFNHLISLLREASIDPEVESIKITLYRIADTSKIANALIMAVKNGKQVTVLMELRARFDEENNINWSNRLQEEGVRVIFGVPTMKVHSKIFLITSRIKGKEVSYAHIGTGNFNENTAKIYSDTSLLTSDPRITSEVKKIFEYFSNNFAKMEFRHLLVSPFNMRKKLLALIEKEIEFAKKKQAAWIILKLNNLVDREMINALYKASTAGVQIKLIVRSTCSLCPEMEDISENISGISIVDKYLEHSRIFIFNHGGEEKTFISSADWMVRNLDRRIEAACPVYDEKIKKELKDLLAIQLADNNKARILDRKLKNEYIEPGEEEPVRRSQTEIYEYYLNNGKIPGYGKTGVPPIVWPEVKTRAKEIKIGNSKKKKKSKKGKKKKA